MKAHDVLGIAGLVSIAVGSWWIYPPASLILTGALLLAGAILQAKRTPKRGPTR